MHNAEHWNGLGAKNVDPLNGASGSEPGSLRAVGTASRRGAQTVYRALNILESFTLDRPTLTLAAVSETVGLTVPTTHRLLKALLGKEMVVWDPLSRRYSLGAGVMRLASVIIQRDGVVEVARGGLERLRDVTGETVALFRLVGDERVCIVELPSPHPIRMTSGVGRSYPLFAGASGKAILAWLPKEFAQRVIEAAVRDEKLTQHRGQSLTIELGQIRASGYAMSTGEIVSGSSAVGAPILVSGRTVIGAINVTGPADRFDETQRRKAVGPVLELVSEIMRQLGQPSPAAISASGS